MITSGPENPLGGKVPANLKNQTLQHINMPSTSTGPEYRKVSKDYLTGGKPATDLENPYKISTKLFITGRETFGCDRLYAQREMFDRMRARPPTLFEELNAAAMPRGGGNRPSRPLSEYYGTDEAGLSSLWLDHLLMGKRTPAMGMQDGMRYAVDYDAVSGNGEFFSGDKARKDLVLSDWEAHKTGSIWVIIPGKIHELPYPLNRQMFRYDPHDLDPETGFIMAPKAPTEEIGSTFPAWICIGPGPRLQGLRPVTIEPGGDVNAVWNLDDSYRHILARMVKRS